MPLVLRAGHAHTTLDWSFSLQWFVQLIASADRMFFTSPPPLKGLGTTGLYAVFVILDPPRTHLMGLPNTSLQKKIVLYQIWNKLFSSYTQGYLVFMKV